MSRILAVVAVLTAGALIVLIFADGTAEIVGFEALVLTMVFLALRGRSDGPRRAPLPAFMLERRRAGRLPPRLVELERSVTFAGTSSFDFDHRLLPLLREIADARLLAAHGFTLAGSPDRAAAVLGDQAWSFLRPDRVPVDDVGLPGPALEEMDRLVAAIEAIGGAGDTATLGFRS